MLDRLNTGSFANKKTCSVRLNGNKMQINAVVSNIEEIQRLIKDYSDICTVYSMQITIADEIYNTKTGFTERTINKKTHEFLMADKITTPAQIAQEKQGAELSPAITQNDNLNAPAIKTYSTTRDIVSLNKWSGTRTISTKEIQSWKPLNKNTDIVVNRNLDQIFPEKTGKTPLLLIELLQHVR